MRDALVSERSGLARSPLRDGRLESAGVVYRAMRKVVEDPKEIVRRGCDEDGGVRHVHVPDVAMPEGWNKKRVELLLQIPPQYPSVAIPGFETDVDLRRTNGAQPNGTGVQAFDGPQFLHFCWNPVNLQGKWISLEQAIRFAVSRFGESA